MKKPLCVSLLAIITFAPFGISAEETVRIETLWNAALETNVDVKTAETEASGADIKKHYYGAIYSPSIVVKGSNTFAPNPQRKDGTLSDASTFSFSYGQPFSGGGTLNATVAYSQSRPFTEDETYAAQNPSLSLSLTQGLKPWWIQGLDKNPQASLIDTEILLREIQLVRQKKTVLIAVTQDFIELRKIERAIVLLERTIALRNETLSSLALLYEQGALGMTKIWDEKQLLLDDENAFVQSMAERERLKENLRTACGIVPEGASVSALPVNAVTYTFPGNLETAELETQIASISLTQAQRKQNVAPSVTLSADISWPLETEKISDWKDAWSSARDDKQKLLYTISLGVDLSPIFSRAGARDRKIEENNLRVLEEKRTAMLLTEENQSKLLREKLIGVRAQTEQFRTAMLLTAELAADAEELARQGALTALELQTYRLQKLKREIALTNSEDQSWYLAWYLEWWMD